MLHKGKAFAFLSFYMRTFRFTPAIFKYCTVSKIRSDSYRLEAHRTLLTCESGRDLHGQQRKFSAFILSFRTHKNATGFFCRVLDFFVLSPAKLKILHRPEPQVFHPEYQKKLIRWLKDFPIPFNQTTLSRNG